MLLQKNDSFRKNIKQLPNAKKEIKTISMGKVTIIVSFIFASLFMLFNTFVLAQNTDNGPKLKIYSGFKGGSYYQMAKDMQSMSRKLYGKANYAISELEVPKIDPTTKDTIKGAEGNIEYDVQVSKTPTGDTIDFLEVCESDGSYYNFLKINTIDVDIAFLQYDVLLYESEKDLSRKFKKTEDIRVLLPLGSEEIHLITLKDSKINAFSDLKKKRVAIGSSLQGTNITATYIKGVTNGKWIDVDIPYDKVFHALFSHDIDAFFFVGKVPVHDLKTLPKSMKDKLKMVSLPENDKLKEAYGEQVTIDNSTYSWIPNGESINTYSVRSLLVTSLTGQTPEKKENIVKLLEAIKQLKDNSGYHESWKTIQFQKLPKTEMEWPYYDAAVKLYN